ncbi:hypothetical protein [Kineosporia babensis]|uniref:FXSXX-COOH protein n=1 Tax=Kineosporia babensis TaxID=499548 RepID=A0A9X1N9D0_9ACTN|nr:hypothetical protein [Kineosporia babensis]MCD5310952.1 hypothetical protein [Kineosporia babensis]
MTAIHPDVIRTRLVDLSGVSLGELSRYDPAELAEVSAPLIDEMSAAATVSLAGSDS